MAVKIFGNYFFFIVPFYLFSGYNASIIFHHRRQQQPNDATNVLNDGRGGAGAGVRRRGVREEQGGWEDEGAGREGVQVKSC